MKLPEIYLLKVGDKVIVNKAERTVKETASNETIKVGSKYRYFSEIQSATDYENKAMHNNYKTYDFTNK